MSLPSAPSSDARLAVPALGRPAPAFAEEALVERRFESIRSQDLRGRWVVLFFYPMDFTFVCPTEIAAFNRRLPEFEERNAVVLGASTDTVYSHLGWVGAKEELKDLRLPLIGDVRKTLARAFGVLDEERGVALRGTFVIDPEGLTRWVEINDLAIGRSVDEVLRVLDALQTGELCPCGWTRGEETLQPEG
jgi:peroxiredoxin (alkyl hydroperoxide reductase subunit C)